MSSVIKRIRETLEGLCESTTTPMEGLSFVFEFTQTVSNQVHQLQRLDNNLVAKCILELLDEMPV